MRELCLAALLSAATTPVMAQQTAASPADDVAELRALIRAQAEQLARQEAALAEQARRLDAQQGALDRLDQAALGVLAGRGQGPTSADAPMRTAALPAAPAEPGALPAQPVGEGPPAEPVVEAMALPEGSGVLTPRGRFTLDPSVEYSRASTNRLVFRGVEIVTGVQIGVIEASDADRDTLAASLAGRYGLTDRLEIEGRLPYVYRSDRVTTLAQRDEQISRTLDLEGDGIGDVEASARYQLTRGGNGRPILVAGLRYKSDTGSSPFEIDRDEFGVASELATGSGFWGVEPSVSFLYPTDPVVLFGSLSYLYHAPKDIDRVIGDVLVGEVDPGDSVGASLGFGFALNPGFSTSLGYRHNVIFSTDTQLGDTVQSSDRLQVGTLTFGWSLRLTDRMVISNAYEIGATSDAPNIRILFRLPYRF